MNFLQPVLENENVKIQPLQESDFERLYAVASDPLVWEQHPNKNRCEREPFLNFFEGAMASGGAFLIIDKASGEVAGSTRFYSFDDDEGSVFIGYTFYGRKFWGSKLNPQVKKLMLDYIFEYADLVKFHVGAENWRSRKAMERLGAELRGEVMVAYHGEPDRQNVEYWIRKTDWLARNLKTNQQVMKKFRIQKTPFVVPTSDGKLIEELWGNSTGNSKISIAHMIAPAGWCEPHQTPEFDEFTYIISGKKQFEIDGEIIVLEKGQSILVQKGARVRYSNPFNENCEYMAICLPAFSMDLVNREI